MRVKLTKEERADICVLRGEVLDWAEARDDGGYDSRILYEVYDVLTRIINASAGQVEAPKGG